MCETEATLGWDAGTRKTNVLRSKEEAHDYRYFPEPDLPPVVITQSLIEEIRSSLPELSRARASRFVSEYGLPAYDAGVLTESKELADYVEHAMQCLKDSSREASKVVSNIIMGEVLRELSERKIEITQFQIEPHRLAELAEMFASDEISSKNVKDIFSEMLSSAKSPSDISKEMGFVQVSDTSFIEEVVDEVLAENQGAVKKYREGKTSLIGFFVGQTMQRTKGKANPKVVNQLLGEKLAGDA